MFKPFSSHLTLIDLKLLSLLSVVAWHSSISAKTPFDFSGCYNDLAGRVFNIKCCTK